MITWKQTDKHVYGAIYREHRLDMSVFGSCTCPEGDPRLGFNLPYILTEWGFKDADEPIIKVIVTKQSLEQKEYDYEYFIAIYKQEDEDAD